MNFGPHPTSPIHLLRKGPYFNWFSTFLTVFDQITNLVSMFTKWDLFTKLAFWPIFLTNYVPLHANVIKVWLLSMLLVMKISRNWHFLTPFPPYKCLRNIWMVPNSFWLFPCTPLMNEKLKKAVVVMNIKNFFIFHNFDDVCKGQLIL